MNKEQLKQNRAPLNPNKTAVAIGYDPNDKAPKIIATGKGYVADKILEKAKQEDIPVHKDEGLAKTLSKLDLGEYVPPELYDVIAHILVYVDRVDYIKMKKDKMEY